MKKLLFFAALALMTAGCSKTTETMNEKENAVIGNIMTRTSVRYYTEEPVSAEQTETLLRAAMAAPTAVNKQPWSYVVITDAATREQLSNDTGKAPAGRAPLLIVICGDMDRALEGEARDYWIQDCSAAAENLLLAAHGMGLGAVWLGYYPITERVNKLREILGMPESIIPLGIMAVGHPAEQPEPKDKWRPEAVHYEKW